LAPIDARAALAAAAYTRIEAGALEERGLDALAAELGVTGRHLRRVIGSEFGASPIQIAQTGRLLAARRLLNETGLAVAEIAYASGFRSLRRFNATVKQRYGAPPTKMRGRKPIERGAKLTVTLSPRGDFHLAPMLAFLRARALADVETCDEHRYARVLALGTTVGSIAIGMGDRGLELTLSENLAPHLRPLVANVRGAFDLDADVSAVDAHLATDTELRRDVQREPGVRVPGALDGFECAVRAVLGQQISVAAARTLATRLTAKLGAPFADGPAPLARRFPDAAALADAGSRAIAGIGLPKKRAATVHALGRAVADGRLTLARGAVAAGRAALAEIEGIGPWTIEYIALRTLGDPDAYPATDAALVKALGRRGAALEHLKPWRAYAATRLWRRAANEGARS
jgi:AraC family transcriptional regulator of adaptative response / DNA-3-methyladenine glycosylase II